MTNPTTTPCTCGLPFGPDGPHSDECATRQGITYQAILPVKPTINLSPELLAQLATTGLSSKAVAERLGIGQKAAARLLLAAGAKSSGGRYCLPSFQRRIASDRRLASPVQSAGGFEHVDHERAWTLRTVVPQDRRP